MQLDKAIQRRKSVRKFKSKKPDWRDIIEAIDSARYAPVAGKNFTMKFIVTEKKDKIQKIAEASQQDFISEVHYVIVACSDPKRLVNSFGERGEVFSRQQAGAAIQNFLLSLEEKGLSTCWIGHFAEDQIKNIFGIPGNVNVEAVFPIGYNYDKKEPREKISLDSILYFDKYKNKKMNKEKMEKKFDV